MSSASFASALYRRLAASPGNLFFSPYSVSMALAMIQAGARGRTQQEIEAALGVPGSGDSLIEAFGTLARELARLGGAMPQAIFRLISANSLWHQGGYVVEPDFIDKLTRELAAEVFEVDFQEQSAAAVERINAWVAKATEGRIPSIVSELPPLTRVLLASAVYFKARWEAQFEEKHTRSEPFHLFDGRSIDVAMMHKDDDYEYGRSGGLQVLRLPYANDWFGLTILFPDQGRFDEAEREVDASLLAGLAEILKGQSVRLTIPRFRLESSFRLRSHLEGLGIADAFRQGADFSGLSQEPGFVIDEVVHKSFVEVDEQGTEAAAATAVVFDGAALHPPKPLEFRVDRPFLFIISDRPTGTILFMGRVVDPRGNLAPGARRSR